jgi:hypothetical protein
MWVHMSLLHWIGEIVGALAWLDLPYVRAVSVSYLPFADAFFLRHSLGHTKATPVRAVGWASPPMLGVAVAVMFLAAIPPQGVSGTSVPTSYPLPFLAYNISTSVQGASSVCPCRITPDSFLDVVAVSRTGDRVYWCVHYICLHACGCVKGGTPPTFGYRCEALPVVAVRPTVTFNAAP